MLPALGPAVRSALLAAAATFPCLAAGGKAEAIVFVADTRRYSGWLAWWTNLYNENLFWFTVITVLVIPAVGATLALLTDFLMARLGINLKSRVLAEH